MSSICVQRLFEPAPEPPHVTYQFVQSLLPFALSIFCVEDRGLVCRAVDALERVV